MRGHPWSTDGVLWWEGEEDGDAAAVGEDEIGWKCWKHPTQPRYGVCPACLRDRLIRLCPDCATVRPCGCSASSSSSSFSSHSSADVARSGGGGAGIGAVGQVARLIESEPAFRRSQSAGFQLFRSRSTAAGTGVAEAAPRPRAGKGWGPLWPAFWKSSPRKAPAEAKMCRSRSVAAAEHRPPPGASRGGGGGGREEEGRAKGLRWHFPSPIKVFRHRKSTTNAAHERSPRWRGSRAFAVGVDMEEGALCIAIRRDVHMAMRMDW